MIKILKKIIRIKLSDEVELKYNLVKIKNPKLLNAILKKVSIIKQNIYYGRPIAKSKIPKKYKEKYSITNLFWVGLPSFWRMLYSLFDGSEIEITVFIISISNHKEYNDIMNYKGK
ncbi:hypothetical protein HQ529_02560 [Candidatus Woesearchaeota archaeon]|nr:hypothetical protein [Candidatus Woesearchaeota archaeon]